LVIGQIMPINPASAVRGPRHIVCVQYATVRFRTDGPSAPEKANG
jgi:hypothetical protein